MLTESEVKKNINKILNESKGNPYHDEFGRFTNGPGAVALNPVEGKEAIKYMNMINDGSLSQSVYLTNSEKEVFANCYKGRKDDERTLYKISNDNEGTDVEKIANNLYDASNNQLSFIHDAYACIKNGDGNKKYVSKIKKERNIKDKKVDSLIKLAKKSDSLQLREFVNDFEKRYKAQSSTIDYVMKQTDNIQRLK